MPDKIIKTNKNIDNMPDKDTFRFVRLAQFDFKQNETNRNQIFIHHIKKCQNFTIFMKKGKIVKKKSNITTTFQMKIHQFAFQAKSIS